MKEGFRQALEVAFRKGCGVELEEVERSERFLSRLARMRRAVSELVPGSLQAEAHRIGYLHFGGLLHVSPGVEAFEKAKQLPDSPPDVYVQAIVEELGQSLIDAAAACYPPEWVEMAKRYQSSTDEEKEAVMGWLYCYFSQVGETIRIDSRVREMLVGAEMPWSYFPVDGYLGHFLGEIETIVSPDDTRDWMVDLVIQPLDRLFPRLQGELNWTTNYNCWSKAQLMAGFLQLAQIPTYLAVPMRNRYKGYYQALYELAKLVLELGRRFNLDPHHGVLTRARKTVREYEENELHPWPTHGAVLSVEPDRVSLRDPNFSHNVFFRDLGDLGSAMDILMTYHGVLPGLGVTIDMPDEVPPLAPFVMKLEESLSELHGMLAEIGEDRSLILDAIHRSSFALKLLSDSGLSERDRDVAMANVICTALGGRPCSRSALGALDLLGLGSAGELLFSPIESISGFFQRVGDKWSELHGHNLHAPLEISDIASGLAWGAISHVALEIGGEVSEAVEETRRSESFSQFALLHLAARPLRVGYEQYETERFAAEYLANIPGAHCDANSVLERLNCLVEDEDGEEDPVDGGDLGEGAEARGAAWG